jgi:starch-binding outer membrane protein, SusD/RagB family
LFAPYSSSCFIQDVKTGLNNMPPDGLVFDEFWQTKENVQSVIMGAYNQLTKMDEKLFIYGEIRGDMVARTNNTPTNLQLIISGNLFPENPYSDWSDFYKVINYCNNVIKYAPEVQKKDITFTEIQMQSFISEAKVIRALMYFYLVRIFKDVPFVLEPSDNDNVNFYLPKTDGNVILSAIKEDLNRPG